MLEGFDWTFQPRGPRADRGKLDALATCAFVRQTENVLFMGPPGVGKSHLAVALGVKAIKNGFSTQHYILDDLMHVLKGDAAVPPRRLRSKRYLNSALLVIDEVGFRPLHRQEANLFFRLVSVRYEKGSIILTFNKHVRDWPEIFARGQPRSSTTAPAEPLVTAPLAPALAPSRTPVLPCLHVREGVWISYPSIRLNGSQRYRESIKG